MWDDYIDPGPGTSAPSPRRIRLMTIMFPQQLGGSGLYSFQQYDITYSAASRGQTPLLREFADTLERHVRESNLGLGHVVQVRDMRFAPPAVYPWSVPPAPDMEVTKMYHQQHPGASGGASPAVSATPSAQSGRVVGSGGSSSELGKPLRSAPWTRWRTVATWAAGVAALLFGVLALRRRTAS